LQYKLNIHTSLVNIKFRFKIQTIFTFAILHNPQILIFHFCQRNIFSDCLAKVGNLSQLWLFCLVSLVYMLPKTSIIWLSNILRGLSCLTPHSTIFQLYPGCQFYWRRKLDYLEKTTDLPQVTDKVDHIAYGVRLA
jgi:hypothetical protein